jgi:hypothetical protein
MSVERALTHLCSKDAPRSAVNAAGGCDHRKGTLPMVTMRDYDTLIAKAEQVRTAVIELNAMCDTHRIPIPQRLAWAWADVLTFPDYVRKVAEARST